MLRPVLIIISILITAGISYSQWTQVAQVSNIGENPSISVADCNTIVIAGGTSTSAIVYRSTNGGLNFSNITTSEINWQLFCCWALNKDTIFTGDGGSSGGLGGNAKVYRTANGGVNWSVILTTGGNSGFISGIVFERPSLNHGIIVSDPPNGTDSFWIAKTTDMGGSWVITKAPYVSQYSTQNSLFIIDSAFYGFGIVNPFGVTQGKIYITSNSGLNWNVRLIGLSANSVNSIAFQTDKQNGIALSDIALPNLSVTTNSGLNWLTHSAGSGTSGVGTVKWVPGSNIYYLAANKIKRTSTGGVTWEEMNTGGILFFKHMDLILTGVNQICAYALCEDGRVLKYEGEPFGIRPISSEIPDGFTLYQNYPNPFNPVTKIRFDVPVGTRHGVFLQINIYDVLGNEISTLVNEELNPGTYEAEFDGTNLPSGVYYCKMSVVETTRRVVSTDSKRMVIVK